VKHAKEYGIEGLGEGKVNWQVVLDRKNQIITKHVKGLDFLMPEERGHCDFRIRKADGSGKERRADGLRSRAAKVRATFKRRT